MTLQYKIPSNNFYQTQTYHRYKLTKSFMSCATHVYYVADKHTVKAHNICNLHTYTYMAVHNK